MEEKHCPKCGTPLEMQDGDLICPKCFEEELKKAIEAKVRKQMQMERLEQEARERILKEEKELFKQERLKFAGLRIEGDYAYYGEFPQSEVNDPALIKELLTLESENNPIHYQGNLYVQLGKRFFLYEPIKWRVLERKEEAALLISDVLLEKDDAKSGRRNEELKDVYAWLGSPFLRAAFPDQGAHILPVDGDPFFLPSKAMLENPEYGFRENGDRVAKPTDYALRDEEYPHPERGGRYITSTTEIVGGFRQGSYVRMDGTLDRGSPCDSYLRICVCVELEEGACKKENLTPLEGMVPRKVGDKILYGRYPQSEVPVLETALAQKYGDKTEKHVVYGDQEYLPKAHYRIEPISWTVIFKNGDDYELVSDKILDEKIFDGRDSLFGKSSIETWLNGVFLGEVFKDDGAAIKEYNGFRVLLPIENEKAQWAEPIYSDYALTRRWTRWEDTTLRYWVISSRSPYYGRAFPRAERLRPNDPAGVRPRIFIHLPPTEEELALEAKKKAEEEERIRREEEAEMERQRLEEEKRRKEEEERRSAEEKQRLEQERLEEEQARQEELRKQAEEAQKQKALEELSTFEKLKAVIEKPLVLQSKVIYGVYPRNLVGTLPQGDRIHYGPYTIVDDRLFYNDEGKWYSVEPITWIILKREEGAALIISEDILDRRRFNKFYKGKKPLFGGHYTTDYAHSEIRTWLNEKTDGYSFLNLAFGNYTSCILAKEVDNSEKTFLAPPAEKSKWCTCENTVDKVFLICERDRVGAYGYPELRTPVASTPFSDRHPFDEKYKDIFWGRTLDYEAEGKILTYGLKVIRAPQVDSTDPGVRPAMWIKIPE